MRKRAAQTEHSGKEYYKLTGFNPDVGFKRNGQHDGIYVVLNDWVGKVTISKK